MKNGNTYEVLFMHDVAIGPTIICTLDIGFELSKLCKLKLARVDSNVVGKDADFVDKIEDSRLSLIQLFEDLEDQPVFVQITEVNMTGLLTAEIIYVEKDGSKVSINDSFLNWMENDPIS